MKKYIPSLLTALNLSAGVIAIILKDPVISPLCILAGAVFDIFDGMVARLLKASSEIGKELDSLADLVSFGVAPAYLYYHFLLPNNYYSLIPVIFLTVFSAFRLAKFNIDTTQSKVFKGLATPPNAIFFLSFPLLLHIDPHPTFLTIVENQYVMYILPFLFSYLLICPLKMFSFKGLGDGFSKNPFPFIFLGSVLISGILLRWYTIPISILIYIFLSVIANVTKKI